MLLQNRNKHYSIIILSGTNCVGTAMTSPEDFIVVSRVLQRTSVPSHSDLLFETAFPN